MTIDPLRMWLLIGIVWGLVIVAALLWRELSHAKRRLSCLENVFKDKPWLADGIVLPADCVPRRFGAHYMDDLILCVKQVGPNENDVPRNS